MGWPGATQGLGQGWVLSSPQGSIWPGLLGVLGQEEEAQARAGAAQDSDVGLAWVSLSFVILTLFLIRGTVFRSWDLLMLSAARLVDAKDGVTASLRKWEVERGWRTEWRDSQPACSGSVEKSIPCSEQPSRAHPIFQTRGADGLMMGL